MAYDRNSFDAYIGSATVIDSLIEEGTERMSSVRERVPVLLKASPDRKRVKGLGDHPIHIGYDRAARLKAAPGMEEFYRDKASKWARIVSCDERRRGGK